MQIVIKPKVAILATLPSAHSLCWQHSRAGRTAKNRGRISDHFKTVLCTSFLFKFPQSVHHFRGVIARKWRKKNVPEGAS